MTDHVNKTQCGLTQEDFHPLDNARCPDGGFRADHPITIEWEIKVTETYKREINSDDVSPELWEALAAEDAYARISDSPELYEELYNELFPEWEDERASKSADVYERELAKISRK